MIATDTTAGGRAQTIGLLAVLTGVVCFSLSYAIIKWPGAPGSVIAWWRLVVSAILWWLVLVVRRARTGAPLPDRQTWRVVAVPGIFFGIYISVLFTAVTKTSVAHTEFINSLAPFLLLPVGFLLFGERPNWSALRWGGLSLVGITIVLFTGPAQGVATLTGDLLVGVGLLLFVAYMSSSKWARSKGVDTWNSMAIVMTIGLVSATPIAITLAGDEMWPLSTKTWFAIGIIAVLTGMIAHGCFFYAHRSVPIATLSTVQVSQPAMSTFWAWVILGEEITATQVPGMALVMIGLVLVVWFSQRRPAQSAMEASERPTEPGDDATPPMPGQPAH